MATLTKYTYAGDIYEDTKLNTQYESLRMKDRQNSDINVAATRKGNYGKRRWWGIPGAALLPIVLLCVGLFIMTSMYTSVYGLQHICIYIYDRFLQQINCCRFQLTYST